VGPRHHENGIGQRINGIGIEPLVGLGVPAAENLSRAGYSNATPGSTTSASIYTVTSCSYATTDE